jgi:hypothetical protein
MIHDVISAEAYQDHLADLAKNPPPAKSPPTRAAAVPQAGISTHTHTHTHGLEPTFHDAFAGNYRYCIYSYMSHVSSNDIHESCLF